MPDDMRRFDGKTVVVTGAGSGIGAATAKRFAHEGANVVLVGRTKAKLEAVADTFASGTSMVEAADVGDLAAMERVFAAVGARFGDLDVLVNNAGTASAGGFLDGSIEDYRRLMTINVDGVVHCCRLALPLLL